MIDVIYSRESENHKFPRQLPCKPSIGDFIKTTDGFHAKKVDMICFVTIMVPEVRDTETGVYEEEVEKVVLDIEFLGDVLDNMLTSH